MSEFITTSGLVRELAEPLHRVRHVLESRGVKAACRVGNTLLFDRSVIELVRAELARIDARRLKREPATVQVG
jgi:hypothetical protein